ncbi:MAG: hypothetical protein CME87_25905 [Herbaspirillum sp.]|nr:hypothetical protein [Herbaspirillum sp.]
MFDEIQDNLVITDEDGYIDVEWSRLVPRYPGGRFDRWSALHRPGAWEWSTAWAVGVRDALMAAGWRPSVAPGAPWRRIWLRDEADDGPEWDTAPRSCCRWPQPCSCDSCVDELL